MASIYKFRWDRRGLLKKALGFAYQHKNVPKVDIIIADLENRYSTYQKEMDEFLNRAIPEAESTEQQYKSSFKKEDMCRKTIIASIIACFVTIILGSFPPSSSVAYKLALVVFFLLIALFLASVYGFFYFKIQTKKFKKIHNDALAKLDKEAHKINRYLAGVDSIYDKVDSLYLASLEPSYREAVLMRREQQSYHRDMLHAQEKQQKEQERILKTQQALLQIELEREERYRRNSR